MYRQAKFDALTCVPVIRLPGKFVHRKTVNDTSPAKNPRNLDKPENSRNKILFENLTPLHAADRLRMERGNGSTEDITARVLDLASPIGKGQRGLIVGHLRPVKRFFFRILLSQLLLTTQIVS